MSDHSPIPRSRRASLGVVAALSVALGAVGVGGLGIASAGVAPSDKPVFISINPCRLVDTRPGDANVGPRTTPLGAGETITVTAFGTNGECTGASAIPADAVGLSLNVTAVGATASTFLTFWGEGPNPGTSNLNPRPGAAPTPNAVSTPLSDTGTFNIFNEAGEVQIIADVNGYYADHDHDDRYYTRAESDAAVDTAVAAAIEEATGPPTELLLGPYDFIPELGSEWSVEGVLFRATDTDPSSDCTFAPLRLAAGQSIERIVIPWFATTAVSMTVTIEGPRHLTGPFGSEGDLFDTMVSTTVSGGTPPAETIVEFVIEPPTPPVALLDTAYSITLCSGSSISLFPIKIELA